MKCSKCGFEQDKPLETYDGRLWCVSCRKPLTNSTPKFTFTVDGEKLFELSEIYYYNYLTKASRSVAFSDSPAGSMADMLAAAEEARGLIVKAVAYCTDAARLGDPRAVARLAYYYDMDYAEPDRNEAMRCKIAADYYKAVCCCTDDVAGMRREEGCRGMTSAEWNALQVDAATRMMRMLASAPNGVPGYKNTAKLLDEIRSVTGKDIPAPESAVAGRQNAAIATERILRSCTSNTRAPLVAVCEMTAEELAQLFDKEFARSMMKKVTMILITGTEEGRESTGLTEEKGMASAIKRVDGSAYLMILNTQGKHALGKSKAKRIVKLFEAYGSGTSAYTEEVIRGCPGGCTLYDDDFIIHMGQGVMGGVKAAADRLMDYINDRSAEA